MHIDNLSEFEKLVRDIKCPLLILFVTRHTKNIIDWDEIEQYKKRINIISIDVDDIPELVAHHHLNTTPSMVVYKGGWYRNGTNGYSPLYVRDIVEYNRSKDE